MGDAVSDISDDDLNFLKCVGNEMAQWSENLETKMNCKSCKDMTKNKLMSQTKETLASFLLEGYHAAQSNNAQYIMRLLGLV